MILVAASIAVLLSAWLAGGNFRGLAELPMRSWWALVTAMSIQVVIIELLATTLPGWLADSAHVVSFVLALSFVWINRRVAGLWIVGLGGLCNAIAIAANGGVMPAATNALETAGIPIHASGFRNSTHVAHAHVAFLGDVFAIPNGWPFANVFSVGDVLLVVGAFVLVHTATRSRLAVWVRSDELPAPSTAPIAAAPRPATTPGRSIEVAHEPVGAPCAGVEAAETDAVRH